MTHLKFTKRNYKNWNVYMYVYIYIYVWYYNGRFAWNYNGMWILNLKRGEHLTPCNTLFLSKLIITNLVKNLFWFVPLLPTHCRYRGLFLHVSHTWTRTLSVGLPWTSDRPVSETSTYTTRSTRKWQTFTPPAGFELTVPASERSQSYAIGHRGRQVKKSAYFMEAEG